MRFLWLLFIGFLTLIAIEDGQGCHRRRKKRSVVSGKSVKLFFPVCMRRFLSGKKSHKNRDWQGAISFTLFHSQWYEAVDQRCAGDLHTVQCWANQLPEFISGNSPALDAAQRCVQAYFDYFFNIVTAEPAFRSGLPVMDSVTCTVVDEEEYEREFLSSLNDTYQDENPEDESISNFDDVVQFAKNDMICLTCSCNDLNDTDDFGNQEASYDFEDGTSCGSCWTTRLATSVRPKSNLRKPANRIAKIKGGLRRRENKMGKREKEGKDKNRGKEKKESEKKENKKAGSKTQSKDNEIREEKGKESGYKGNTSPTGSKDENLDSQTNSKSPSGGLWYTLKSNPDLSPSATDPQSGQTNNQAPPAQNSFWYVPKNTASEQSSNQIPNSNNAHEDVGPNFSDPNNQQANADTPDNPQSTPRRQSWYTPTNSAEQALRQTSDQRNPASEQSSSESGRSRSSQGPSFSESPSSRTRPASSQSESPSSNSQSSGSSSSNSQSRGPSSSNSQGRGSSSSNSQSRGSSSSNSQSRGSSSSNSQSRGSSSSNSRNRGSSSSNFQSRGSSSSNSRGERGGRVVGGGRGARGGRGR